MPYSRGDELPRQGTYVPARLGIIIATESSQQKKTHPGQQERDEQSENEVEHVARRDLAEKTTTRHMF